ELGLRVAERPRITRSNIVCAEPMPGEWDMLNEFLTTIRENVRPARLADLVEDVWQHMRLADEAGSLLKVEQALRDDIKSARLAYEAMLRDPRARTEFMFPELAPPRQGMLAFDQYTDEAFWDQAEDRVLTLLRVYAESASDGGYARRLFAEDAARGFAFIDLLQKRFDVVLMNPPFGE